MPKKKRIDMARGERTSLTKANANTYSLRTTVPKGIVNQFELKEGDSLFWVIQPGEENKGLIIVVRPERKVNKK